MQLLKKKKFFKKLEYQWGAGVCDLLEINGRLVPADQLHLEFQSGGERAYAHTYYTSRSGASGAGNFWYSPVTTEAKIACQLYQSWGTFIFIFRPAVLSEFAVKLENGFEVFQISRDGNEVTIAASHENPESILEVFADGMSCDIRRGQCVPRWAARAIAYEIFTAADDGKPVWETHTVSGRFSALRSPCGYIKYLSSNNYVEERYLIPMLYGFGVEAETENLIVFLKDDEVLVVDKINPDYEWGLDLKTLREKGSEAVLSEAEAGIARKKAIDVRSDKQKNFGVKECAEILNANPELVLTVEDSFKSGNCQYGTREFMKKYFQCADSVTAQEVLGHKHLQLILNNPQFRRVVFNKFFPAIK